MLARLARVSWLSTVVTLAWALSILVTAFFMNIQVVLVLLLATALLLFMVRQDGTPWLFVGLLQGSMGILVYLFNNSSSAQIPEGITLPAFALLTLVGFVWTLLRYPARSGRLVSVMSCFVIMFSIMVFSGVLYSWHDLAFDKALKYAATCLVSVYAGLILDKSQRFKLYDLLVVVGLILSVGIGFNWLTGGLGASGGRFGAFGIDTLGVGVMVGVVILVVWYLPRYRRFRLLFGLVLTAGLLLAASRGPILAIIVTPVILPFLAGTHLPSLHLSKRTWLLFGMVGVSIVGLLVWVSISAPSNLVENWGPLRVISDTNLQDPNIVGRLNRFAVAVQDWLARPLLGWGTAGYTGSSSTRIPSSINFPHNIFLEILAEWGLLGLALFGAILLRCISNIRILLRLSKSSGDTQWVNESLLIGAMLLFTLVRASFSGQIYNNQSLWLVLGLSEGLRYEFSSNALPLKLFEREPDLDKPNY